MLLVILWEEGGGREVNEYKGPLGGIECKGIDFDLDWERDPKRPALRRPRSNSARCIWAPLLGDVIPESRIAAPKVPLRILWAST